MKAGPNKDRYSEGGSPRPMLHWVRSSTLLI